MGDVKKSYRIKANVGADSFLSVNLEQDYEVLDILSLKIDSQDLYRLHNSNYGVVVGRVLANNGFGIPNAKISVFIGKDDTDDEKILAIYPYSSPASRDENGVRYNLLPDEKISNCHQIVGTFPNKRYLLDNEDIIETFDKYYKYTTRTNNAGDYIICGVPTGNQILHMDLDLSDCGILSQRPRDFVYKGYTVEQFENPNMFKTGTNYSNLSQIFTQDQTVYVRPFWGNESLGEEIGITRADIDVAFKFEPTCVFMGSIASDPASQGISKKCIPTPHMGDMDELVTGEGTIEMIRKTYAGSVEEFQVKGTELINGDGIWCYQIPMNLDYMMTDEYGNMVPTDNPDKGIPTRTRVRFRISMQDFEQNTDNYFRPKVLVPHNPQNLEGEGHDKYDYEFGSFTSDESFRDLFWNEVYTVKSYIPRIQKRRVGGWKESKFTGIKQCQAYGKNNPIPYNNIRIRLPFMFKVMCILIKIFIKVVKVVNSVISMIGNLLADLGNTDIGSVVSTALALLSGGATLLFKVTREIHIYPFTDLYKWATKLKMNVIDEGMCPDLENWYFAPVFKDTLWVSSKPPKGMKAYNLLKQTLDSITTDDDPTSIDDQNQSPEDEAKCLTTNTDYLVSCIEMNLAQEYRVINFDFYNDWVNGLIYIPRFMRYIRKKRKFLGITIVKAKIRGCMDDTSVFAKTRRYTQMCSVGYKKQRGMGNYTVYSRTTTNLKNAIQRILSNNLHKQRGLTQQSIFGKENGGICHEKETMYGHHVYYLKPCEWVKKGTPMNRKVNLFATDIVLLGSLNECDPYGIPQAFKHLTSSSYIMPTNLALTNMEENGWLYAYGDNGTICSTINQTTENTDINKLDDPVNVVGGTLTEELKCYKDASENYDTDFEGDPSDTLPMTEAAGIAWNYTGPDQGNIDARRLYYPGGHFLGLSCVNSQTNIKSCINLERICEVGSSMSQRRENVRAVNNDFGDASLEYTYEVPTGLIAGNDIVDDEFRVMFSTMNKKRLIATKTDPKTGYKVYDFDYVNPVNFNGELVDYGGQSTPYNTPSVNVTDESATLAQYGIANAMTREDYDPNEAAFTKTRTIEFPSVDYYLFRMGLDYSDLTRRSSKHMRQFAKEKGGDRYLPQYENSYYFYFGMKDGSTALDEFNKQFFSECESSTLIERETASYMVVTDFDPCAGVSTVIPFVKNMDGRLVYKITFGKHTVSSASSIYGIWEDENEIDSFVLGPGEYKITITDEEGVESTAEFSVGNGLVNANTYSYDFNVSDDVLPRNASNKDIYHGGYISFEDLTVNVPDTMSVGNITVLAVREGDDPKNGGESTSVSNGRADLYLASANTPYDVYMKFRCQGCDNDIYSFVTTINLLNSKSSTLLIGAVKKLDYKDLQGNKFREGWWNNYDNVSRDDIDYWNIRKSLVKTNAEEPFSNNVIAKNGNKVIFGSPQNEGGIYNNSEPLSSDYDANLPVGYSLDDDATYHPVYGCSDYAPQRQYTAAAYNGLSVGGDFVAKVTGGTGTVKRVSVMNANALRDGGGCIFKPLPDGDLYPAIYHSSNNTIECIVSNDDTGVLEDLAELNVGVVYPTFLYTVIDKPFSVNANYFVMKNKGLVETTNENGELWAQVVTDDDGGKCEARITNGLTYGTGSERTYGGNTFMAIIDGVEDEWDEGTTKISVSTSDLANVGQTSHTDKVTYRRGWTEGSTGDLFYSVQEGGPFYTNGSSYSAYKHNGFDVYEDTNAYMNAADTAEIDIKSNLYNDIYYEKENNGMLYFEANGASDPGAKYYIVPMSELSSLIALDSTVSGYTFLEIGKTEEEKNVIFLLGRYTNKAKYDVEGKDVVVKLFDPSGWLFNSKVPRVTIPFTKYNESDGTYYVEYETDKIGKIGTELSVKDINNAVNQIKNKFDGRVDFDRKYRAVEESKTRNETDSNSWTRIISGATSAATREINPAGGSYNYGSDAKFAIIGKISAAANGNATANLFRVYANPIRKIKTVKSLDVFKVMLNNQYLTSIVAPKAGDTYNCVATVSKEYATLALSVSSTQSWCTVRIVSSSTDSTTGEVTKNIEITVAENSGYEERRADVEFKMTVTEGDSTNDYTQTVSVRQTNSTEGITSGSTS